MLAETAAGAGCIAVGGYVAARSRRMRLYRRLHDKIDAICAGAVLDLGNLAADRIPGFKQHLAVIPDILPPSRLAALRQEAEAMVAPERNFIPTHKKGGTVAYETLIERAPAIVALYHARDFHRLISRIVGLYVEPTPIHDQSSLSILFYDRPGDHIGWHFDHNFYRGRHYTVLLPLINEGGDRNGLSHARLIAKLDGHTTEIGTPPNTLVVFEGARVHHKVSPILAGERRLVLSMTYSTDPCDCPWQAVARRIKDTAFIGVRALWT